MGEYKLSKLSFICMAATPFGKDGTFDEGVARDFYSRQIDADLGLYLGSGGAGEGHALTTEELRRLYRCGVALGKGRVTVQANIPEQHTVAATIEQARIAIDAGIEVLNIYPLEGRHGMRPSDAELEAYFDGLLTAVQYPTVLGISPSVQGYMTKADIIARMANKHQHVQAVRLHQVPDTYLIELRRTIDREMAYLFQFSAANLNPLALGVAGLFAVEANIMPKTCRKFMDCHAQGDQDGMMRAYIDLRRFDQYVGKWTPGAARPLKMAIRALKLPGWEGGLRLPYLMPDAAEMRRFTDGLLALGIAEIDEIARVNGIV